MKKDPDEILPFCMRCFAIGAVSVSEGNFCHNCRSGGTCIDMKRSDTEYLRESIKLRIDELTSENEVLLNCYHKAALFLPDVAYMFCWNKQGLQEAIEKVSEILNKTRKGIR